MRSRAPSPPLATSDIVTPGYATGIAGLGKDQSGVVPATLVSVKTAMNSGDLPQNVNFAVKSAILLSVPDANGVLYKVGTAGKGMEPADIADRARAMSGFVECR